MKTLKMNLENIQGKMNRKEMRNIMAGGSGECGIYCPGSSYRTYVPSCSRADATQWCFGDPAGATCTCY